MRAAFCLIAAMALLGCGPQPDKVRSRSSRASAPASVSASASAFPVAYSGVLDPPSQPIDALKARTYALAVQGSIVHAGTTAGVVTWSFQDKSHPKELATLVLPGSVAGLALLGQALLAVAVGPSGLALVDTSNASRGRLQALNTSPWSTADRGGCHSVWAVSAIDATHAVLACGTGGVAECDLSDPARPRVVRTLALDGYVRDVAVLDAASGVPKDKASPRKVAVAAGRDGLVIVEFPALGVPKVLARAATTGEARALEVHAGLAYVADGPGGLCIVDVRAPVHPAEVSRFDPRTVDLARGVTVHEQTAFLCLGDSGLMAIDTSDPKAPRRIGGVDPPRAVNRARAAGNLVFSANDAGGILLLDAAHPEKLEQLFPPAVGK
jgi:hypothetical protein